MRDVPSERRVIATCMVGERTHLLRVIPSQAAGPDGCDTLCGLLWTTVPNYSYLEFGPGLPDEAECPDGMCPTCWKALCLSGCWNRESWGLCEPVTKLPGPPKPPKPPRKPRAKPATERQEPDPDVWQLEVPQ